ncbi:MAG: tryptophanyl-tRNA synthetase [Patescibacteria group bacterium]|jgi:tryptophanyl-tRNA synthetase
MVKATVNPYEISGVVDYDRLIKEFGLQPISDELIARIERIAGEVHPFIRRGIFFAHRDLEQFLSDFENGKPVFLYTGIGPSGPIHIGHYIIWSFAKWLQDTFNCELWFQFTDDEKFLYKDKSWDEIQDWTDSNMLDVIAIGFDPKRTHFLVDTKHAGIMYPEAVKVAKKITFSTIKSAFGFTDSNNIGSIFYTSMQTVPTFLPSVLSGTKQRCLVPLGVDQDPHFRISRDVVEKLGYYKPAIMHGKMLPALTGINDKSSSSNPDKSIMMTDTLSQMKRKINRHAFSGGRETVEEHREKGANIDVDVACQWLKFFEEDDKILAEILGKYKKGELLSGEVKAALIDKVGAILTTHQKRREKASGLVETFLYSGK